MYEYGCRSEIACEAPTGASICRHPDDLCFQLEPRYHPIASSYRVDARTKELRYRSHKHVGAADCGYLRNKRGENAMRKNLVQALIVLTSVMASGATSAVAQQQAAPAPSKFKLTTSAYSEASQIPNQYTCADTNVASPPLQWSNAPKDTASFALIFHDTDAAPAKGAMDVTHWILWNLPASSTELPGGVQPGSSPDGIQQGRNIRGANGYQGPCPPPGSTPHHYIFELYALDQKLDLTAGASRADLLKAMDGHVIGKASYVGLFGR